MSELRDPFENGLKNACFELDDEAIAPYLTAENIERTMGLLRGWVTTAQHRVQICELEGNLEGKVKTLRFLGPIEARLRKHEHLLAGADVNYRAWAVALADQVRSLATFFHAEGLMREDCDLLLQAFAEGDELPPDLNDRVVPETSPAPPARDLYRVDL